MSRHRPQGETRADRYRQWMIGLGVAILLMSCVANVIMCTVLIRSGDNHHAQSARQNTEILGVLNEHTSSLAAVKDLRSEFNAFVKQAAPAIEAGQANLQTELTDLTDKLTALCAALPVSVCAQAP